MHESEKWKWSHSVVSDCLRPHGLQPTRLLCPWDCPGKSTGVGCHRLLWDLRVTWGKLSKVYLLWGARHRDTCAPHRGLFLFTQASDLKWVKWSMFLLGIRIEEWDLRCIFKKCLLFGCHWADCDAIRCNHYNNLYNDSGSNILMTTNWFSSLSEPLLWPEAANDLYI